MQKNGQTIEKQAPHVGQLGAMANEMSKINTQCTKQTNYISVIGTINTTLVKNHSKLEKIATDMTDLVKVSKSRSREKSRGRQSGISGSQIPVFV